MELTTLQAVDLFLESLHTRFTTRTIKLYCLVLQQFLKQAPTKLSEVTTDVIFAFLDSHVQHNPAIRQQHAATLRAFYFWLMQQRIIQSNPMEQLPPIGHIERLSRPLDPDDVTKFLKAIPTSNLQDRAIFTLIYETGMRVGEVLSIRYKDLDLTHDNMKIRVFGKDQLERSVQLTDAPESNRLLHLHLKHSQIIAGCIFLRDRRYGRSAMPLDYSFLFKAWKKYCEQAGIRATIHQLRRCRAIQLF